MAAHSAAKGAVVALSRVFATDGAPHGIRAVTISPGPIKSPELERNFLSKVPGAEQMLVSRLLADRVGTPEDVAALAVFVASDEAAWLTGVDIILDGGYTAHDATRTSSRAPTANPDVQLEFERDRTQIEGEVTMNSLTAGDLTTDMAGLPRARRRQSSGPVNGLR